MAAADIVLRFVPTGLSSLRTKLPRGALRLLLLSLGSAIVGASAGCNSPSYAVKVDSMVKRDAPGVPAEAQSYKIRTKNPAQSEAGLRHLEAAEFVKTALSAKGMYEAPSAETADMIVELDYGVDAPRTRVQVVSVPRYGQVGGGVSYERVPVTDPLGNTSYRTVAVYQPPRTELMGFDERPQRVTVYEKYLRITARENKPGVEGRPPAELWSVQTSTEDESKDLRKYLPIMASATADNIGKESGSQKVVKVKDQSQGVDFIRKGMGNAPTAGASAQGPVERPKI